MFSKHFHLLDWPVMSALADSVSAAAKRTPSETTAQEVNGIVTTLEATIQQQMALWGTPGMAVGIVAEDRLVYAQGFGIREKGQQQQVTPDSLFEIGSTTKAFLGVTLAICVEEGLLRWTDKVVDHYPDFRLADSYVTRAFQIEDLLAQRSGLPFSTLTNLMVYGYARKDIIRALRAVQPVTSFRSTFAYQNAFHLVADNLVAQLSGMPSWDAFLQARLLGPLGMTHTTTEVRARHDPALRTSGHLHLPDDTVISPDGPFLESAGGAGNIRSSVTDLAQWLRLHLGQGKVDDARILHANSLAPTYIPRIALEDPMATDARLGQDDTMSYATGWITHATPQGRLIEHSGGTIGYNSHIGFDPDRKFGFVVLVNQSYQGGTGLAVPLGKTIVDLLQGRSDSQYPKAVFEQIQADMLMQRQAREIPENARPARPDQAYVGRYDNPAMGSISIQASGDGGLGFTLGPYKTRVQLTPYSGDVFLADVFIPTYDGSLGHLDQLRVRFFADDNDEIVGMRWLGEGDHAGQPAFERCG